MIFTFCELPTLEEIPVVILWHDTEFVWRRGVDIGDWLDLWWGKHWDN